MKTWDVIAREEERRCELRKERMRELVKTKGYEN